MQDFKQICFSLFRLAAFILLTAISIACSGRVENPNNLKSAGYSVFYAKGESSEKWGNYLYLHLQNRIKNKNVILLQENKEGYEVVKIDVNPSLEYDFCIINACDTLQLNAKTEKTALWLIYQYIKNLSVEDERISADDLPPAIINFNTKCDNYDFAYREPFFNPNMCVEYAPIIGTNSLETNWGIWGHNLSKVVGEEPDNSVYARVDMQLKKEQFCFSSEELYLIIKRFIINNYGTEEKQEQRFMIMPNDNDITCLCPLCDQKGNTHGNATPAVSALIKRLAKEFPHHLFFSSSYLTTQQAPDGDKWPVNTGVMVSTIDLPKGIKLDGRNETSEFLKTIDSWKRFTDNIYIWDYASNFDDYLTPIPVLYGLKQQLPFYKFVGVNGVFLNASGYDYSPFQDMKTFVAAALMIDMDLSVDSLCTKYLTENYPVSGKILADYYLSLEKRLAAKNKPYNIYGGFREAINLYFDKDEFVAFYNSLESLISRVKSEEKRRLIKLQVALSYPRLQLAYVQGGNVHGFATLKRKELLLKPDIKNTIYRMSHYRRYKDLSEYKEARGDMKTYLANWERLMDNMPLKNLLVGEKIEVLSKMDEEYRDVEILNDGVPGFFSDYHQGWFLCSGDDLVIRFNPRNVMMGTNFFLRFLIDERHGIFAPEKIEIYKDNILYKEVSPSLKLKRESPRTEVVNIGADLSGANNIELKIYRKQAQKSSLACDEIRLN